MPNKLERGIKSTLAQPESHMTYHSLTTVVKLLFECTLHG